MRIQHNIMAMNANRNLTFNNSQMAKNLEKLSSGYRINRAGDDAAGLAISEKMRAEVAIYDQSIRNANDGIALIQTAEGALTEVHSMLNRMETLVTQSANGTYGATNAGDRPQIQEELAQLVEEINRISTDTKFNGISLLDNDGKAVNLQVSDKADGSMTLTLAKIDASELGVSAIATTVGGDTDGTASAGLIETVRTAIKTVSTERAKLGAVQNRMEHTVNNLGVTMENLQNAESQIRDTNIADEMMKYTKNNILIQSAQAMLAQANQVPQGVLQLMQ